MARSLKYMAGLVVSGAAGWTFGTYRFEKKQREKPQAMLENPLVSEFIGNMQIRGYRIKPLKSSFFLDLHRQYMYTQAVLTRKGRLHSEGPITLQDPQTGKIAMIFHVGNCLVTKDNFPAACAAIFDEGLAQTAFPKLPNKIGLTGTLKLSPVKGLPPRDGFVVLQAQPTFAKGRRSEARGQLIALSSGKALANGEVVMIEPWWGKYLALFT